MGEGLKRAFAAARATRDWKLKRTVQCAKCPWRKDANPLEIPNGYDVEKHRKLEGTIAKDPLDFLKGGPLRIMACHETHSAHCVGWLENQLGQGNNISLRMLMRNCSNLDKLKTIGEQHETFEETLPK